MNGYLLVFLGGGLGAALRHGVNRAALAQFGPALPYGTFFVNLVGSLLMGVLAGLFLLVDPFRLLRRMSSFDPKATFGA